MKKVTLVSLGFLLALGFTSCGKWDGKKKDKADYYYSEDYRDAEGTILSIDVAEIDVLYSAWWYEGKTLKYKLVAEEEGEKTESCYGCKEDYGKVLAYEEGRADVDDQLNITFVPDKNPTETYTANFENKKNNYKVYLPGLETRELNFILKK